MEKWMMLLEEIAEDPKMPGYIVDWACRLYDSLANGADEAMVRLKDLRAIDLYEKTGDLGALSLKISRT